MKLLDLKILLLATRPKTLPASAIPILVGACLSKPSHLPLPVLLQWAALCLACALCLQIAVNFINDALDFRKGADTPERLGPQRASQTHLPHKQIFVVGLGVLALAALLGLALAVRGGWPIAIAGVGALLCTYMYTGGPYPLAYRGLGDIFVLIFFGLVAVCGTTYVLTHQLTLNAVVASCQIGCLATTLIAINNLRDTFTDRKAGKWTLAARFGLTFGRTEITALFAVAFVLCVYWFRQGYAWSALAPLVSAPLAVAVCWCVWRWEPSRRYNALLGISALCEMLFGVALSLGVWHDLP